MVRKEMVMKNKGQGLPEYQMIVAMISIAIGVLFALLGESVRAAFFRIIQSLH